ncbi:hypothetical protein GN244_ATG17061 [Phytophthora infestans]|uniref:Transmembrane protein n=1 Tax=Phytophthora infestans TaxID=4787 RepID=A0A833ST72_PHYIN|nr:hypothetical protein GN244_ATG17061 [Phytophthora infestans]
MSRRVAQRKAEVEVFAKEAPARTLVSQATPLWRRLEERWDEIQIGRQGSYSVERLESLEQYCKSTSRARVLVICLCTPLPALTTGVLVECLPLQRPSEGELPTDLVHPRTQYHIRQDTHNRSGGFSGTGILAASTIGFPVPLMMQFGSIPVAIYAFVMTLLVLGPVLIAKDSPFKAHFDRYNRFFAAFMMLCGVFPIYRVVYEAVPMAFKTFIVVILPFVAKHFLILSLRELVDVMPVLVALSVDFMITLFIAVCMSTSGSFTLTILIIAADFIQSWLEFREMRSSFSSVAASCK